MFILDFSFKSLATQLTESGKLASILGAGVKPSDALNDLAQGKESTPDAKSGGNGKQAIDELKQQREKLRADESKTTEGVSATETQKSEADSKASQAMQDSQKASQDAVGESNDAINKSSEAMSKRLDAGQKDAQASVLEKSQNPSDRAKAAALRIEAEQLRIEAQQLEIQARQHLAAAQQKQAEAQQKMSEAQSEQANKSQVEGQKSNFEQQSSEIKSNLSQVDTKISEAQSNLSEIEEQKKSEKTDSSSKPLSEADRKTTETLLAELKKLNPNAKEAGISMDDLTQEDMEKITSAINESLDEVEGKENKPENADGKYKGPLALFNVYPNPAGGGDAISELRDRLKVMDIGTKEQQKQKIFNALKAGVSDDGSALPDDLKGLSKAVQKGNLKRADLDNIVSITTPPDTMNDETVVRQNNGTKRFDKNGNVVDPKTGKAKPGGGFAGDAAGGPQQAQQPQQGQQGQQAQQPDAGQQDGKKAPPIGNAMGFLMAARALLAAIARLTAVASLNSNPIVQIAKNLTNKGLSEQAIAYLEAALVDSAISGSPVNQQIILTKAQANTIHGEAETNIPYWKEVINQNKQLGKQEDLAKPA